MMTVKELVTEVVNNNYFPVAERVKVKHEYTWQQKQDWAMDLVRDFAPAGASKQLIGQATNKVLRFYLNTVE